MLRTINKVDEGYLLSGAENFPNGDSPLIDDSDDFLLYVGAKGRVEVVSNREEDDYGTWSLPVSFPNAASCAVFIRSLPGTVEELEDIGFTRY